MGDKLSPEQIDALITAAVDARSRAYAVYSNFKVGAALLTREGKVYQGCNIENISFTPTVCAERVAMFKAISDGNMNFQAVAIISSDATPTPPCGVCRQVMSEFVDDDFEVILTNDAGRILPFSFREVLPMRFVPQSTIGKQDVWEVIRPIIQQDDKISEDESKLVQHILRDMETLEHQITIFINDGKIGEEERERVREFRQRVYRSAVDVAHADLTISDEEQAILQKLAELLEIDQ